KDEDWKNRLLTHLEVMGIENRVSVWDDRRIQAGDEWLPKIEKMLHEAEAVILLISADFLASYFIQKVEIPRLLERRKTEGLRIFPLIMKPCAWQFVPWLSRLHAFPKDGVPLSTIPESKINRELAVFTEKIFDFVSKKGKLLSPPPLLLSEKDEKIPKYLTPLPVKSIELVGRETELEEMTRLLARTHRVLLVNGLGGVGKTELCKRYFRDHCGDYRHLAWVDVVGPIRESMVAAFTAETTGFREEDTVDERFEKIMDLLTGLDTHCLLVVDDIENPGDPDLDRLRSLPVKVIANSRLTIEGFENHTLDFLNAEGCKELFYNFYAGKRDDPHVEKIVERCGRHTLSVELLAKTAEHGAIPLKDLYEVLEKKGFDLTGVVDHKVSTSWHGETEKTSFFKHLLKIFDLTGLTGDERFVLANLSVLPAMYIEMGDVRDWLKLTDHEAVNSLVAKGWLRKEAGGFGVFMHQVIQEVVRYHTSPDEETCKNLIVSLTNCLHVKPTENPMDKKRYIIFAETLLRAIDKTDKSLAALSNNLSLRFRDLGSLKKALEFQLKALNIFEQVLDKNHPDLARSYNNLAEIYRTMGQPEKALEFQLKALNIFERVLDKNHPDLA
ncbi:MAG: toll/interleukin-1 receptor domain-containing protein, partial [bacterium]|nr:toll/interleukin-1 receptor domain-containing protein [bacterium]